VGPPVHFYIWYRVSGDVAAIRVAIAAMMADVSRRTGIAARLLVRHDEPSTWMEVYEGIADAATFEHEMAGAALRHGIARIEGLGVRHVEAFVAAG
jgi:Domain of unknown function (DUF4936)